MVQFKVFSEGNDFKETDDKNNNVNDWLSCIAILIMINLGALNNKLV